jgi:hypothetical protein
MTAHPASRPFAWRAFVSLVVALAFLVLAITAVARLRAAGLQAAPEDPLREIARNNGRHAPEVLALVASASR